MEFTTRVHRAENLSAVFPVDGDPDPQLKSMLASDLHVVAGPVTVALLKYSPFQPVNAAAQAILRQDPDVILVGEIRDEETARIAVQAALTGHLVMTSLHATDASSALFRLLDMGIESFLVASSLVGVVGQRLVRQICPSCTALYQPTDADLATYERLGGRPKVEFSRGLGCNYCSQTGYRDRIGVYEVLEITDEIRQLVVERATPHDVRTLAAKQGMRSMGTEAMALVADDVTTIDEVIRTVYV